MCSLNLDEEQVFIWPLTLFGVQLPPLPPQLWGALSLSTRMMVDIITLVAVGASQHLFVRVLDIAPRRNRQL